jgi:hypothetical protein
MLPKNQPRPKAPTKEGSKKQTAPVTKPREKTSGTAMMRKKG